MAYKVGRCCIRELRKSLGWTQKRLSTVSGVSNKTISHYETGRRKDMPLMVALPIAEALGVHPRELFEILSDEVVSPDTRSELR